MGDGRRDGTGRHRVVHTPDMDRARFLWGPGRKYIVNYDTTQGRPDFLLSTLMSTFLLGTEMSYHVNVI